MSEILMIKPFNELLLTPEQRIRTTKERLRLGLEKCALANEEELILRWLISELGRSVILEDIRLWLCLPVEPETEDQIRTLLSWIKWKSRRLLVENGCRLYRYDDHNKFHCKIDFIRNNN